MSDNQITMKAPSGRSILVMLLCVEGALLAARICGAVTLHIYDDAFITLRHARNLANGVGFVYHPGEWLLGVTCPLFGLLTSLLYVLNMHVLETLRGANILFDAAVLAITFVVLVRSAGPLAAGAFGALFALSPMMTRICVGGMEADLFLLAAVGAIALYHRGWKKCAIIIAAASYYLRPEAVLLVGTLCCIEALVQWRRREKPLNPLWMGLIALAVAVPPLFVINHFYGHPLPHCVVAKAGNPHTPILNVLGSLLAPDPLAVAALAPAAWGLVIGARREGFVRTWAVFGLLYVLGYAAGRPHMWSWYGEPVHFAVFLLAAIGAADLLNRVVRGRVRPLLLTAAGSAAVAALWVCIAIYRGPSPVRVHIYRPIEQWAGETDLAGQTILAQDIGAIGYYTDATIYDTAGLVWPPALETRSLARMIVRHRPDYLLLNWSESNHRMMTKPPYSESYEFIRAFGKDASRHPGELDTTGGWRQEYWLYRKVSDAPLEQAEASYAEAAEPSKTSDAE